MSRKTHRRMSRDLSYETHSGPKTKTENRQFPDPLKKYIYIYKGSGNGRFSVLVFGPKWVSYERSRGIRRWVLREISARAFL